MKFEKNKMQTFLDNKSINACNTFAKVNDIYMALTFHELW